MLMDLGATVCRPTPRCEECPLAARCAWHVAGHPAPDPAIGSAGVSTRQAPYDGSDRQRRGDVLRALHHGPRPAAEFPPRIVDGLVADRLVVRTGDSSRPCRSPHPSVEGHPSVGGRIPRTAHTPMTANTRMGVSGSWRVGRS